MDPELLVCDIGNTSIKLGFANESRVLTTYSLPVKREETADSLGLTLLLLFQHAGIRPASFRACAVASVVPDKDAAMREAIARYVGCPVYFAPRDMSIPLENRYERPEEVGADRLVGAYAARKSYPDCHALIVVDYGTAVTFDCIEGQAYLGGLIFPGPATAMEALAAHAAKLPAVNMNIRASEPTPCRDTATSISHGLVFGFVSVTEGLCARLRRNLGGQAKIVATGGFAAPISRLTNLFDAVLPALVLDGLRILYFEDKSI